MFSGLFKDDGGSFVNKIKAEKKNFFSKAVEGGIFESALAMASKHKSAFAGDENRPWDFEEEGPMDPALKKAFFGSSRVVKADAKRTDNTESLRTLINKTFNDQDTYSKIRQSLNLTGTGLTGEFAQKGSKKTSQIAPDARIKKSMFAAKGLIPNFAPARYDDRTWTKSRNQYQAKWIQEQIKQKGLPPQALNDPELLYKLGTYFGVKNSSWAKSPAGKLAKAHQGFLAMNYGDGFIPNFAPNSISQSRLNAINMLAQRGVGGERDNAKRLAEKYKGLKPKAELSAVQKAYAYIKQNKQHPAVQAIGGPQSFKSEYLAAVLAQKFSGKNYMASRDYASLSQDRIVKQFIDSANYGVANKGSMINAAMGMIPNFAYNIKSKFGSAELGETDAIELQLFEKALGRKLDPKKILSIEHLETFAQGKGNSAGLYQDIQKSSALKGRAGLFGYTLPQNRSVDPKKASDPLAKIKARFPQLLRRLQMGGTTYLSDDYGRSVTTLKSLQDLQKYQDAIYRMKQPAALTMKNFGKGFMPNFGYVKDVMALESSMSGSQATFHTAPFPHIRNKSQPTFASAMRDHGGLRNAMGDSLRNQAGAGIIPNFAQPIRDSKGKSTSEIKEAEKLGFAFKKLENTTSKYTDKMIKDLPKGNSSGIIQKNVKSLEFEKLKEDKKAKENQQRNPANAFTGFAIQQIGYTIANALPQEGKGAVIGAGLSGGLQAFGSLQALGVPPAFAAIAGGIKFAADAFIKGADNSAKFAKELDTLKSGFTSNSEAVSKFSELQEQYNNALSSGDLKKITKLQKERASILNSITDKGLKRQVLEAGADTEKIQEAQVKFKEQKDEEIKTKEVELQASRILGGFEGALSSIFQPFASRSKEAEAFKGLQGIVGANTGVDFISKLPQEGFKKIIDDARANLGNENLLAKNSAKVGLKDKKIQEALGAETTKAIQELIKGGNIEEANKLFAQSVDKFLSATDEFFVASLGISSAQQKLDAEVLKINSAISGFARANNEAVKSKFKQEKFGSEVSKIFSENSNKNLQNRVESGLISSFATDLNNLNRDFNQGSLDRQQQRKDIFLAEGGLRDLLAGKQGRSVTNEAGKINAKDIVDAKADKGDSTKSLLIQKKTEDAIGIGFSESEKALNDLFKNSESGNLSIEQIDASIKTLDNDAKGGNKEVVDSLMDARKKLVDLRNEEVKSRISFALQVGQLRRQQEQAFLNAFAKDRNLRNPEDRKNLQESFSKANKDEKALNDVNSFVQNAGGQDNVFARALNSITRKVNVQNNVKDNLEVSGLIPKIREIQKQDGANLNIPQALNKFLEGYSKQIIISRGNIPEKETEVRRTTKAEELLRKSQAGGYKSYTRIISIICCRRPIKTFKYKSKGTS
jgi:hypothetical protein